MEMDVLETLILLDKLTKKRESHLLSFFKLEIIFFKNSPQNFFNYNFFQVVEYFNE